MNPKPKGSNKYFWIKNVTIVEIANTKVTAAPIPIEVSTFLETPKNGQIPKNCDNTTLLTNTATININIYSIQFQFYALRSLFTIAIK